jgi:hypothetical protein
MARLFAVLAVGVYWTLHDCLKSLALKKSLMAEVLKAEKLILLTDLSLAEVDALIEDSTLLEGAPASLPAF